MNYEWIIDYNGVDERQKEEQRFLGVLNFYCVLLLLLDLFFQTIFFFFFFFWISVFEKYFMRKHRDFLHTHIMVVVFSTLYVPEHTGRQPVFSI